MESGNVEFTVEDLNPGGGDAMEIDDGAPVYTPVAPRDVQISGEIASVRIPRHRLNPLKENWMKIYQPIVEHMKLQIRFNTHSSSVELRTSEATQDIGALQKSVAYVRAFVIGFDLADAIALLRIEDLYVESFDIDDVKNLNGDHLARAIGRVAGHEGKTKHTIENSTRTRIVLADKHVHILGSYANIQLARDAVVSLILGSPPGKVYGKLRVVSSRINDRI